MTQAKTTEDLEKELGRQIRALRLRKNQDQESLAGRAGVALSALKNLESGKGAALKTFLKVLRALGRTPWLDTLAPAVSISPLQMLKPRPERQRASRKRPLKE
jgi:transcriptional regulator with XRE-family HTH domain